ncbi:hypothetical protein L1987_76617 [Smallanthus sonchifolius]|uniref:Uncharacterized protein n=1 Tax=Smallanthus sonchifolius TaxID=185202 RepID=A0ACB8Z7Y3_9ASTR|nr:hypothetical protein L1987_76617 [Smallanthus sonchifolius]
MGLLSCLRDCLQAPSHGGGGEVDVDENHRESWDLFFNLQTLQVATNFFSQSNQLGHGGFGPVYKGLLANDFGLARLFPGDDTHFNTFRISGTHGYMAPEYAMHGYLSVKADVFSFGILVLEIVSGRKVSDRQFGAAKSDLLTYAWSLFQSGKQLELVDETLIDTCNPSEALMCIQLGLLCCQAIVADRPDMNTLHLMISNDSFTLPKPGKPGLQGRGGCWTTTTNSSDTKASTTLSYDANESVATYVQEFSINSISYSSINEGR